MKRGVSGAGQSLGRIYPEALDPAAKRANKMASEMLVLENFIGGKFVPCANHIDSYDPSTGKVYCKVPDSGKEEVDMAVKAASEAFER